MRARWVAKFNYDYREYFEVGLRVSQLVQAREGSASFEVAVPVPTESGDWDLLLSSTGTGKRTRLLPKFVRRWQDARLGTLVPYRYRGELVWFMAVPDGGEPPTRFTIHTSGEDADWRQVAAVTLNAQNGDAPPPAFDPVLNRPPDVEPVPRRRRWS